MTMELVKARSFKGIINLLVVFLACKEVRLAADQGDLEAGDFFPIVKWWSILTILFLVELWSFVIKFFELVGYQDLSVMI